MTLVLVHYTPPDDHMPVGIWWIEDDRPVSYYLEAEHESYGSGIVNDKRPEQTWAEFWDFLNGCVPTSPTGT